MKKVIRYKWGRLLLYGFITITKEQKGITSLIPNSSLHYVLLDMDDIGFETVKRIVQKIANKYNLANCVIMSDKENSYRVFSNTPVTWRDFIKIMVDTDGLDYSFFKWSIRRGYATIRIDEKKNRSKLKIVDIINYDGVYVPEFENFELVVYNTDE